MYDAIDDPYTYENSTVLVNKLGLRSQAELEAFEAEISSVRAEEALPEGTLDFAHYKAIHHHLFQDVYDWADRIRTVRMSKGGNPFCFQKILKFRRPGYSVRAGNYLQNLDATTHSSKAAHFLAELNAIHAFRDGNGRSQLTFFSLLSNYAGHPLDLDKLPPKTMLVAMIASFEGQEQELTEVIKVLTSRIPRE